MRQSLVRQSLVRNSPLTESTVSLGASHGTVEPSKVTVDGVEHECLTIVLYNEDETVTRTFILRARTFQWGPLRKEART